MIPSQLYHFDVLPLHPQPYPLESFTGYLTRLAQLNQCSSFQGLHHLLYRNRYRHLNRGVLDCPRRSFGQMARAAVCPEETLRATTFYHLGVKFDQPYLYHFLSSSVASHLRYCPGCLAEQNYYRLFWRFTILPGCPEHDCVLLDRCPQCNQPVPLFATPFRIGVCPFCDSDLRTHSTRALTPDERELALRRTRDLVYLLSPQSWEHQADTIAASIGPWLTFLRREWNVLAKDIACYAGASKAILRKVEDSSEGKRGGTFQIYTDYADYLGISWYEVFQVLSHGYNRRVCHAGRLREASLLLKVLVAVHSLEQSGQPLTRQAIGHRVGMTAENFKRTYPVIEMLLNYLIGNPQEVQPAPDRKQEVLHQVQATLNQLEPLDSFALTKRHQLPPLPDYQSVLPLVAYLSRRPPPPNTQEEREQVLLTRALAVYNHLRETNQPITQKAIGKRVGMSPEHMKRAYPAVNSFLRDHVGLSQQQQQYREHALQLLHQAQQAVDELEAEELPITLRSVGSYLQLAAASLYRYPEIIDLIQQAREKQGAANENDG